MPIDRISSLRNCGVFREFTWPADLSDFGRYNLIYGWNGTGKTTISRVFRALELHRPPPMGEAVLRIDGADVHGQAFTHSTLPVRVFNRDFINESVFPVGGGDVPPIFVVGKENVEKQKEVDTRKRKLKIKAQEILDADSRKKRAGHDLENHCQHWANRVIKERLRSPGTNRYNTYDKSDYKRQAEQMAADGDATTHRLTEAERDQLLAQVATTRKRTVSEVVYSLPDLKDLADSVAALLNTTVVSAAVQALKDDSALAEWTRHGLGLHKDRKSEKCLFCQQPLPQARLAELEAHFNAEYERFLHRVEEMIQSLESARKQAAELRVPDRAALYDDLSTEYDAAEQGLRRALEAVQGFLGELVKALDNKKAQPFKPLTMSVSVPALDTAVVDRLNAVVRKHNQACDDFDRRVSEARDRLALDMIAESLDQFVRLRDAVQEANTHTTSVQHEVERLTGVIERLEREIVQHRQPAEELNDDLRQYLGHGELQLEVKDTGYSIARNGMPADMLSEGEMTAIALLYFLKSLEDRDFDKRQGVVVLDDPVSSLDANALYLAFAMIREKTEHAGQFILLTHDFALFRQVRYWLHKMPGQKRADVTKRPARFYMVQCNSTNGLRSASLTWIDRLLEEYESEYHYLFACVYRVWAAPPAANLEDYYHVPNIARRLLEGFLAFKVPQASGDLRQALQHLTFDDGKKTRILRFLHTHSHGRDVASSHDPSVLGECKAVLQDMLALMQSTDEAHYSAMVQLVDSAQQQGDTR